MEKINKFSFMYFVLFFIIFLSVYLGLHYYVYSRIVKGLLLSPAVSNWLKLFFLVAALSFVSGELLSRKTISSFAGPIAHFGSLWIGIISIAFSIFLIADILKISVHLCSPRIYSGEYYSTIISLVVIFLLSVFSIYNVVRGPIIKELKIKVGKLPQNLSGFTIVQLSDLHLSYLKSEKWLNTVVENINRQNPDVIVITGDLIDADLCKKQEFNDSLRQLKAKYGVFAVAGNHEFYSGIENFLAIAKSANISVLRNGKTTIAGSIELAGIDDHADKRFSGVGPDLKTALKNCDFKKPVILLAHQPDIFDEAVKSGVDLQLSGHTHAGQIPPMDLIVMCCLKYPYGLYSKNSAHLYTTSGTGIWGPPMRLFSRSEIVKIVLMPI